MKSKCGKNKTAAHEPRVECRITLPHFDVGCDQSFRVSTKRIRNYSPSFSMSGSFVQQNFNSYRSDHHSVNSSNLVSRVSHLTPLPERETGTAGGKMRDPRIERGCNSCLFCVSVSLNIEIQVLALSLEGLNWVVSFTANS